MDGPYRASQGNEPQTLAKTAKAVRAEERERFLSRIRTVGKEIVEEAWKCARQGRYSGQVRLKSEYCRAAEREIHTGSAEKIIEAIQLQITEPGLTIKELRLAYGSPVIEFEFN
jgi:hypothetical protein